MGSLAVIIQVELREIKENLGFICNQKERHRGLLEMVFIPQNYEVTQYLKFIEELHKQL